MRSAVIISAVALAACVEPDPLTLETAQLLMPADMDLVWDASFNGVDDGLGALVPVDVMVYEGDSGEPLEGAFITLQGDAGASVVPADAVVFDTEDCDGCAYDAWRDAYVSVDPERQSAQFATDRDGLARVYVYVDWFDRDPGDTEQFRPVSILATLGPTEESFFLDPQ